MHLICGVWSASQLVRPEPPHSIEADGSVVMMVYSAKADKHAQCSVINDLHTDSYQTTCHSWIGASRPLTCTAPIDVASSNLSLTACQTVSEINN